MLLSTLSTPSSAVRKPTLRKIFLPDGQPDVSMSLVERLRRERR